MTNKKVFYEKYVSYHVRNMYGVQSLEKVEQTFPILKSYFARFLPSEKSAKVLDLGCGSGEFVYFLRSLGFVNVEGIDVSEEQAMEAKRLGIAGIFKADALAFLKTRKKSYDLIVARDFLEHFTRDELMVLVPMIFEALDNKGICIAQTINAESLLSARLRYADFTHEVAFTQSSICQLLYASGFSKVKICPMRPVIRGLASFLRYCLWRLIECSLHIYLIVATGYRKGIFTQDLLAVARK